MNYSQMFVVLFIAVDRKICAQIATITIKYNDVVVRVVVWYIFDVPTRDLVLNSGILSPV